MPNSPTRALFAVIPLLALTSALHAAPAAPAPAPAVTVDLVDPQAALGSYFQAQKANDLTALNKCTAVTVPEKKNYVSFIVSYEMWARYLERLAIAKWGKEEGIKVEGHVRSLDDQTDMDIKRVRDANVEYNNQKDAAKIYLRIERNRPDELQTDRFQFLDIYYMVKTAAGWQVDFLKTYKCLDPDQEDNYKAEQGAFPRMARNLKKLAQQLQSGQFKTAEDLQNTLNTLWSHVYDEPTDASGQTAAETQAAATQAAPAATRPAK